MFLSCSFSLVESNAVMFSESLSFDGMLITLRNIVLRKRSIDRKKLGI